MFQRARDTKCMNVSLQLKRDKQKETTKKASSSQKHEVMNTFWASVGQLTGLKNPLIHPGPTEVGMREPSRNRRISALRRKGMVLSQKEKNGRQSWSNVFQSLEELQVKKTKAERLTKGSGGSSLFSFYFLHFAYFMGLLLSGRNPWKPIPVEAKQELLFIWSNSN